MKSQIPLLLSMLVAFTAASAQTPTPAAPRNNGDLPPQGYAKIMNLWPGEAPLARGTGAGDVPELYYYPASGPGVHSAVIVLPGGGYVHLVMQKEGAVAAKWLAVRGVAAFVLQYRHAPEYRFPAPMLDGARAVRYVRSHASEFGLDANKIGVWGFSAGGHLAGYLATEPDEHDRKSSDPVERVSARPDFAILSYARLSMEPSVPRTGNLESLLGKNPTLEMIQAISIVRRVTKETSPSFIYSTTGDKTVNSLNATAYYDALKHNDVPVELHIFELGPHGTGIGQNLDGLSELEIWPTLLEHWLQLHDWMSSSAAERERLR